jgi:hypothetical protein
VPSGGLNVVCTSCSDEQLRGLVSAYALSCRGAQCHWRSSDSPHSAHHVHSHKNGGGNETQWGRRAEEWRWEFADVARVEGASIVAWRFCVLSAGEEAHCGSPPYIPGGSRTK